MFLDFYNSNSDWVPILWKALAKDSENINTHNELGNFITNNFCNRFHSYSFEEEYTKKEIENKKDLFTILKHDAYIEYSQNNIPDIAYTGDLIKEDDGKFLLNLRAQCDITRKEGKNKEYNPDLYLIEGVAERVDKNVITNLCPIRIGESDNNLFIGNYPPISMKQDLKREDIEECNNKIKKCINDKHCFYHGALIERKDSVLFPYIEGEKVYKFNINKIKIRRFDTVKDKRIGRIVAPYLTRIQQKVANYIFRQGLMPIPEEVYIN